MLYRNVIRVKEISFSVHEFDSEDFAWLEIVSCYILISDFDVYWRLHHFNAKLWITSNWIYVKKWNVILVPDGQNKKNVFTKYKTSIDKKGVVMSIKYLIKSELFECLIIAGMDPTHRFLIRVNNLLHLRIMESFVY